MTTTGGIAGTQSQALGVSRVERLAAPGQPERGPRSDLGDSPGTIDAAPADRTRAGDRALEIREREPRFRVDDVPGGVIIEVVDGATGELLRRIPWHRTPGSERPSGRQERDLITDVQA